jgi:hypothetical protein
MSLPRRLLLLLKRPMHLVLGRAQEQELTPRLLMGLQMHKLRLLVTLLQSPTQRAPLHQNTEVLQWLQATSSHKRGTFQPLGGAEAEEEGGEGVGAVAEETWISLLVRAAQQQGQMAARRLGLGGVEGGAGGEGEGVGRPLRQLVARVQLLLPAAVRGLLPALLLPPPGASLRGRPPHSHTALGQLRRSRRRRHPDVGGLSRLPVRGQRGRRSRSSRTLGQGHVPGMCCSAVNQCTCCSE